MGLLEVGYDPAKIMVADSAGGNLALGTHCNVFANQAAPTGLQQHSYHLVTEMGRMRRPFFVPRRPANTYG
jgi:hypothetical protein